MASYLPASLRHRIRDCVRGGIDIIFSPECAFCFSPAGKEGHVALCRDCWRKLASDDVSRCGACGHVVPEAVGLWNCTHCRKKRFRFSSVTALGTHDGVLRESVLRMKSSGQEPLAMAMSDLIWERHGERLTGFDADVVAPVPMHWRRRMSRGVNSPELLAEHLGRRMGLPVAQRLLVSRRNIGLQRELSTKQRFRNVRDAFRPAAGYHLMGTHVLLVDDVLTTGATCSEAARTLLLAGAGQVDVVVLSRAVGSI